VKDGSGAVWRSFSLGETRGERGMKGYLDGYLERKVARTATEYDSGQVVGDNFGNRPGLVPLLISPFPRLMRKI
jgi:hypothetical protein